MYSKVFSFFIANLIFSQSKKKNLLRTGNFSDKISIAVVITYSYFIILKIIFLLLYFAFDFVLLVIYEYSYTLTDYSTD